MPYFADSAQLFAPFSEQAWAVFLDSASSDSEQGRYDILAFDPVATLQVIGTRSRVERDGQVSFSDDDPFQILKQLLLPTQPGFADLPFSGGAIGYFGYDLARRIEKLPVIAEDAERIPDMAIGIYHWAVVVDHQLKQSWLVGHGLPSTQQADLVRQFSSLTMTTALSEFRVLEQPRSNMNSEQYASAFNKIKTYLREGDCYQINLTQRFDAPCEGSPWQAYQALRQINPAPFSAFLHIPENYILSSSPERFLRVNDGKVETKPIKGTRPRSRSPIEDLRQITELAASQKDQAENVMIVDLLRNDLSKSCRDGSVRVPELFAVESYATVHHLVSTVTGHLADGRHAIDLLRSCFPGGSITGAPKVRAMEIIEELEPNRRGVYCGAIGYIGFDGNMDTNIAIRTLVQNHGSIRCWAGGGIVNDSQLESEYQESFDKAEAMLRMLNQFRI